MGGETLTRNSETPNEYFRLFVKENVCVKYYVPVHYRLRKKQNRYKDYIFTSQYTPKEISSKIKRLIIRNKMTGKLERSGYYYTVGTKFLSANVIGKIIKNLTLRDFNFSLLKLVKPLTFTTKKITKKVF